MKTIKTICSTLTLIVFATLFYSCGSVQKVSRTVNTYEETRKNAEDYTVTYNLPIITPAANTKQTQTKGGVTVSCEVIPFTVSMKDNQEKNIACADPNMPGYDVFEISHTPAPEISPKQVKLNIKIKNQQDRVLKVRETLLLLQIDGVTFNIPEGSLQGWSAGMIMKDGVFNYEISGPELNSLINAKLVYLFINDVPTIMDEGGNIKKRENFEWYFECKTQPVQKQEKKTFTYETSPIYKEKCAKCSGTGIDPTNYKCTYCDGSGRVKSSDGKYYKCGTCDGSGIVHHQCPNCLGLGMIELPKSSLPRVTSSITWTGWQVNVTTNPPGAKVSMVDTKTGEYKSVGMSNVEAYWYSSNAKSYPIIIEYKGQTVKVLPYNDNGKEFSDVNIDFLGATPTVIQGQKVN